MPCPILCPAECLRSSRMPFTRVRTGVLASWLHAIRDLTLQIPLILFFPPRHDALAKAHFQLEASSLGHREIE